MNATESRDTLQTCRHCQAIIDWSAGSRAWLEHRSRWTQGSLSRLLCDRSPAGLHEPLHEPVTS